MDVSPPRGWPAPKPDWPGGAACVVCVTVHMDGPALEVGRNQVPLGIHSRGRGNRAHDSEKGSSMNGSAGRKKRASGAVFSK